MQRVSLLSLPMGVDPFWEQSCQAVPKATEPGPDGVRVAEKTFEIKDGQAIDVKISVDHDMVEVFVGRAGGVYLSYFPETGVRARSAGAGRESRICKYRDSEVKFLVRDERMWLSACERAGWRRH